MFYDTLDKNTFLFVGEFEDELLSWIYRQRSVCSSHKQTAFPQYEFEHDLVKARASKKISRRFHICMAGYVFGYAF